MSEVKETTPVSSLAIRENQVDFDELQIAGLRQLGLQDVDKARLQIFFHICKTRGLDPFLNQIYLISRKDKNGGNSYSVQTGIDAFRIISLRSKQYAGMAPTQWCGKDGVWKDVWLEGKSNPPAAARVGVLRKGFSEPLYAVAVFDSYCPRYQNGDIISPTWKAMPEIMIAKCAEALARRQAFPEDLSGIYTDDEMEQADAYSIEETKTERPVVTKVEEVVIEEVPLSVQDLSMLTDFFYVIRNATNLEQLGKIFTECAEFIDTAFPIGGIVNTLRQHLSEQAKYIRSVQVEENVLPNETE